MAELSAIAGFFRKEYITGTYPVKPEEIAGKLGIGFSTNDYGKAFDGLLENINGKFHIYLNTHNKYYLHSERLRFSFAHELGHYLIPEHYEVMKRPGLKPMPSFQTFDMDNRMEVEADYFAAALLLPEDIFIKDTEKKRFNFGIIAELAGKFNVSLTAVLMRFIDIGNCPIMVVCTRNSRIAWKRFNDDFPFYRIMEGLNKAVPVYTSAGEYFYEGTKNLYKTETVNAKDWFILSNAYDRNRKFNEYCIYQDELNQVISVLWEG